MSKAKFDLGAMLAGVSEPDTGREQIEYIPMNLIDDDVNNFYKLTDLEDLAANIALCGLQQPIRLRPNPENPNRYIIVSGHRRRAAIKLLAKDDPEKWSEIACIVQRNDVSPSLQQLQLIYANSNTRVLTPAEIGEQALQVEKLLYQLKEEGYEFPGRMRDHVAAAVNASTTKLARLKVIREKLAFCWQPAFKKSELGESTAYALAQMPSKWQDIIHAVYGDTPRQLYEGSVKEYHERFKKIEKTRCGSKKDIVCVHQAEMMKRSCKERWSDPCRSGCCMDCVNLQTCRSSCAKAAGKKKELKDTAKEANIRATEERIRKEKPTIDFIREVYKRVGIAREAGCVSVQSLFEAQKKIYSASIDDPAQEKMEDGTGKFTADTRLPFGYYFSATEGLKLVAVADLLNCSIDFLLGRSEELRPAGGWQAGNPQAYGTYVAYVEVAGAAKALLKELLWDGEEWFLTGQKISDVNVTVKCWMEHPEEIL